MHGKGFIDVDGAALSDGAASYVAQRSVGQVGEDCAIVVARFAGRDQHHATFGWLQGPDDIKAALVKSGEVLADSVRAGKFSRETRTSYPVEPD